MERPNHTKAHRSVTAKQNLKRANRLSGRFGQQAGLGCGVYQSADGLRRELDQDGLFPGMALIDDFLALAGMNDDGTNCQRHGMCT